MATPSRSRHQLAGQLGPLLVDVRTSDRATARPAVVILHGYKGFKDWGMFPALAERVARAGFTAVSFNVSGSGVDDAGEFRFPERFGHNTYSAELADILTVLDALAQGALDLPPTGAVGLVGHSRGGGTAILTAARDRRVQALVTWAPIGYVSRWAGREAEWRANGKIEVTNARTGLVLPLYTDLLEDTERRAAELDIAGAATTLTQPWLLLHGRDDESVPLAEAERLAAQWQPAQPRRMLVLDDANHTFGAVHPFAGMTPALAQAFDETLTWLGRHL